MAVFHDTPETAETLTDPSQGVTTVTGNFPSFDPGPLPQPPAAAPVVRSITQITVGAPSASSIVITPPVGTLPGDTLFLSISESSGNTSSHITPNSPPTAPWALLRHGTAGSGTIFHLYQYIKSVWPDDPSSHTFTVSPNQVLRATLVVIIGQTNIVYSGFQALNGSLLTNHPIVVPAIPTDGAGPALVIIAGTSSSGSWGVGSTGYTEQADFGSGPIHALFTRVRPEGTSSVTATFTTSPSNRSVLGGVVFRSPGSGPAPGYTGWLKLVLTTSMEARLNTYGSPMNDTKLYVFTDPLPTYITREAALYYNDDTIEEPYYSSDDDWGWSSLASDGTPIIYEPGTYWILVHPWDGDDWDTSEGNAILTIERIDLGPSTTPPRGTPLRFMVEKPGDDPYDLAPVVVPRLTELNTAVQGELSLGYITVRDIGQSVMDFVIGSRITVDFGEGSKPIWTGYLIRPGRRFWFDVDLPDTLQRQWRLHVVDINILFGRRVLYRKSDPTKVTGPKYLADTADIDAIADMIADWLDLSTDDLDVTEKVQSVGNINDGQVVYPWNGSMLWRDAMANVAQLPAAVFGLNAMRQLVYADVDEENAPFVLTDRPPASSTSYVGYREFELVDDGSQLANDALCWGAGNGAARMVFKRLQDAASIAAHGLWQESVLTFAVWKQRTINRVANSLVNGSPQSLRGRKDDVVSVKCVIHENGLMAGDRVRVQSFIWDFDDILPVRRMKMTFPTAFDVRYELLLSHSLDRWGFEDPMPPININPLGPIPIDYPPEFEIDIPNACIVVPGQADTFDRASTVTEPGPWNHDSGVELGGAWLLQSDDGDPFGTSSDSITRGTNDVAEISLVPGSYFAAHLPYDGEASWNKEVTTGKLIVAFESLEDAEHMFHFRFGAATAILNLSSTTGSISLETSTDLQSDPYTGWLMAPTNSYQLTILLNLPENEATLKVYENGSLISTIVAATVERPATGSYVPDVYVRSEADPGSATDFVTTLIGYADVSYLDGPTVDLEEFFQTDPTTDGWGAPWVVYANLTDPPGTPDPGLEWEASAGSGKVTLVAPLVFEGGMIHRPLGGGAHEIRFSVSDYTPGIAFTMMQLSFGLVSTTRRNLVRIGNDLSVTIGSGSGSFQSVSPSLTLFDGQPVNVVVRWARPTFEVTVWAVGDPEPDEPTLKFSRVTSTSDVPDFFLIEPWLNDEGDTFTIGPIDNVGAVAFLTAGEQYVVPIRSVASGTTDEFGRIKSWPFEDPADGRTYPVVWGGDSYVADEVNTPSYVAWAVWATDIGGTDYGPGYPLEVVQRVASKLLPKYQVNGVDTSFDLIVRGMIRIRHGLGSGGTAATYTATIKSYDYGLVAGPTPPDVSDYFLGWGTSEASFSANVSSNGTDPKSVDQPFEVRFNSLEGGQGITIDDDGFPHFQWGVEILNPIDDLIAAGPFLGGEPHWIALHCEVFDVTYEQVPHVTLVIGRAEPCPPLDFAGTPTSPGDQIGGEVTPDETDPETVFYTPVGYVAGSLRVFVNGKILRWGVDFVETNPLEGVFTLTDPIDPDVDELVPHYQSRS